jgi:hypothetical protein
LQTDAAESASSITLSALLLIAKEKGAFITENYQLRLGWKKETKEKSKRIIKKMVELMDEDEKEVIIFRPIPTSDGNAHENWKSTFKEKAVIVEFFFEKFD